MTAVFVDRDGVINENRDDYVKSLEEFKLLPGVVRSAARLTEAGLRIVIISNQQGIARGLISPEALRLIDERLLAELAGAGARVAGVYYCPHAKEDNCDCRKPRPGLLLKAAAELGIDLARSVFVGDSSIDIQAGVAAGCRTVLVLTGKTAPDQVSGLSPLPDHVARNLSEAVDWILQFST